MARSGDVPVRQCLATRHDQVDATRIRAGFAVQDRIQFVAKQQFARAPFCGDAVDHREGVEPHCDEVDELDDHQFREAFERKGGDGASCPLFQNTNAAFNLRDVFVSRRHVDYDVREEDLKTVKLHVHEDGLDGKTSSFVDVYDTREKCGEV